MRVVILQLFHEANGFSPIPIGLRDFRNRHWCEGEEARRRFGHTRNWFGGALAGAEALAGPDAVKVGLCTASHPGGIVMANAFNEIRHAMLASLQKLIREHGAPDIVLLLLHGALLVEGCAMPEGELTTAVRKLAGPDAVIACAFDFHGNLDPLLVRTANLMVAGRLYPHTDTFDRGRRLAELAFRHHATPKAERHPTRHVLLPVVTPLPRQESNTPDSPMAALILLSEQLAAQYGLDDLTLMGGFHFADTDWTSMSVLATGGEPAAQEAAIHALAEAVWERRATLTEPVPDLAQARQQLRARLARPSGMILAVETGDNPGGGGTGRMASLLPWLVSEGVEFAAGFFVDPALARAAAAAGVGGHFQACFGGEEDPVVVPAEVVRLCEIRYHNTGPMMRGELLEGGPGAVLRVGKGVAVVTTERIQAYDIAAFEHLDINLAACRVVLVKSSAHFRASYTPVATGGILLFDGGGWSSSKLDRFPYRKRVKTILPLRQLDRAEWLASVETEMHRSREILAERDDKSRMTDVA